MSIGVRIRELRGKTSQRDYAQRYGVALNTLRNYESDTRTPSVEFLKDLAVDNDVSIEWLILGSSVLSNEATARISEDEKTVAPCRRCAALESELSEERRTNRQLNVENRELWKENGELKVRIGELNVQVVKLEGELDTARTIAKEYHEELKAARAAPEDKDSDDLRHSA